MGMEKVASVLLDYSITLEEKIKEMEYKMRRMESKVKELEGTIFNIDSKNSEKMERL